MISGQVLDYDSACDREAEEQKKRELKRQTDQFLVALEWISAGQKNLEATHQDRFNVLEDHPKTCDWIGQHDTVNNWLNVRIPTHSILWLNGHMGAGETPSSSRITRDTLSYINPFAGKSTLTSYIIDLCQKGTSAGDSTGDTFIPTYFYCKGGDPDASTFLSICRGLLYHQLMHINGHEEKEKFRHLVAYCYDKKSNSGQLHLNADETAESLLKTFFDIIPFQYIIVDGLDECEKPVIKYTIRVLSDIVSQQDNTDPGKLRLLIVSRDMIEIRRPLSTENITANIFTIEAENNDEAIKLYVNQRLNRLRREVKLKLEARDIERIDKMICDRAQGWLALPMTMNRYSANSSPGMFLFARLVLDNLRESPNQKSLLNKVDTAQFPKDLGEAYVARKLDSPSSPPLLKFDGF